MESLVITNQDFTVCDKQLHFKKDSYPLSKIKAARVKTNTLRDHALRVTSIGLIVSSVVWMICPDLFGMFTGPLAISIGMLAALASLRKYELQVEFQHIDETGLQWVSVAKSNKKAIRHIFEQQANEINNQIA
ncbi:hypothetical protein BIY21_03000 [Vibrio ponticus]|uniref:DUF4231 domain-containing protein n=1 Tax=Vibrio ponticus TaxID=265668 RepID=A0ABX3FFT6_9VIBR|nr:hypothetical protein BIY21_03000 [Vibrio ponticus]